MHFGTGARGRGPGLKPSSKQAETPRDLIYQPEVLHMNAATPTKRLITAVAGLLAVAAIAAACSSAGSSTGGLYGNEGVAGATATPAAPAATQAPAAPPAAGSATVLAKTLGSQTILVAGSNGMTVYTFSSDVAGSGKSACSGGCLTKWPALTVAAGAAPTAGSGVTGALGTITRTDDGTLQVTYNGLPLYFFSGDHAAGDTNGSYPNWNLVKP
jgi:predicted lipoprotein with Yx(FWY)xxD motif